MSGPFGQFRRRLALGAGLPAVMVLAGLLPLWLLRARLPESLATNWNWHGQPTSATQLAGVALIVAAVSALPAFGMFRIAFLPNAGRGEISAPMGVSTFALGSIVAMSWIIIRFNLDAATWKESVAVSGVVLLLLSIGAIAAFGAVVARASRPLETATGGTACDLPSAGLAPGARAMWVGTVRPKWMKATAVMLFALLLLSLLGDAGIGPIHVILGLNLLLFASIRVIVDRSGVRITYGLLGWPVQRVRLAQIRHASVLQVKALPWGGWVYQGSLKLLRRASVVVREGPGIRLELAGDRTLDIAIDEAEQAAGVINDLIAAKRGAARG